MGHAADIDSLLRKLDQVLSQREAFVRQKLARIDGLKEAAATTPQGERFTLYSRIAGEYEKFVYDSASVYIGKMQASAQRSGDPVKVAYARMKRGFILLSSGMFNEALDTLLTIRHTGLPDSLRREHYATLARTYFDLVDFNSDEYFTGKYTRIGLQYVDSALVFATPATAPHYALAAMRNVRLRNLEQARKDLRYMLSNYKLSYPQLAIATSTLGHVYQLEGKSDSAIAQHISASIADNVASTKETLAILRLAELLYARGDLSHAYEYVKIAMDDANFYGARHRKVQVAAIFPIIEGNRLSTVERQRKLLIGYAVVITVLSLVIIGFAVIIYKQSQKIREADIHIQEANRSLHEANQLLQETNKHLQEANKIKEEYIGYYFNINSEYLMKIAAFKQAIDNKLMAKKFDDIRLVVNNINLKKEREELYVSFDKVFLKLFPDFVDTFNSYFKDEDRIVPKDGNLLTTELRIFALIRMGIHDTEKIAKILDYSINTIYNYKARIKGKSLLPNEEFETKIMEIKAI
jgi:tetratricopeptide (TPR) repeat protein